MNDSDRLRNLEDAIGYVEAAKVDEPDFLTLRYLSEAAFNLAKAHGNIFEREHSE